MSTSSSTSISTLIIVCCHAIYLPSSAPSFPQDTDPNWLLEPFQRTESQTFVAHIKEGLRQLRLSQPHAILAFSGGATKRNRLLELGLDGSRTEAESYLDFARENAFFEGESLQKRVVLEEWATDSFQNLLLSLIRFGGWCDGIRGRDGEGLDGDQDDVGSHGMRLPEILIVVSHEFKRARFMELHMPAIASLLPSSLQAQFHFMEVEFIGIDPPFSEEKMAEIREGDRKRGYGAWKTDSYGIGELLSGKRRERGWDEDSFLETIGTEFGQETTKGLKRVLRGRRWEN